VSFDSISKISSVWPVLIHSAVLQVTSYAATTTSSDLLYALSVGSTGVSDGIVYALSTLDTSGGYTKYSFDARQIAIRWLNNASIHKVVLCGYSESTSFDWHSLYGAIPNKNLKPRIIITYSVQR
jgi:hypothetical protein